MIIIMIITKTIIKRNKNNNNFHIYNERKSEIYLQNRDGKSGGLARSGFGLGKDITT
jgi:hypothetical protein